MAPMGADLKSIKIICVNLRFSSAGPSWVKFAIFQTLVAPAVFPVTVRLDLRGRADFW